MSDNIIDLAEARRNRLASTADLEAYLLRMDEIEDALEIADELSIASLDDAQARLATLVPFPGQADGDRGPSGAAPLENVIQLMTDLKVRTVRELGQILTRLEAMHDGDDH